MKTLLYTVSLVLIFSSELWGQVIDAPKYKQNDFWQLRVTSRDYIGQGTNILSDGDYLVVYDGQCNVYYMEGDKKDPITDAQTNAIKRLTPVQIRS